MMVSMCSVVSDNEDTLNLVEGEKVYVMDRYNADWWFIRKQLTNEKGWTESHNLMDAVSYTHYVEKKLNEKIDKLPVFESKSGVGFDCCRSFNSYNSTPFQNPDPMTSHSHRASLRSFSQSTRQRATQFSSSARSRAHRAHKSRGSDRRKSFWRPLTSKCTTMTMMSRH
jgi:hypothetical protein